MDGFGRVVPPLLSAVMRRRILAWVFQRVWVSLLIVQISPQTDRQGFHRLQWHVFSIGEHLLEVEVRETELTLTLQPTVTRHSQSLAGGTGPMRSP